MKKLVLLMCACGFAGMTYAQGEGIEERAVVKSDRADGRLMSTYAIVHEQLKDTRPKCAYRPGLSASEFARWQDDVRTAMARLMHFPARGETGQPSPVRVQAEPREGYTLEKWEFYPFPKAVATFLVLRPDGLTAPVPGVLCIPGSGSTKEALAGEPGVCELFTEDVANPRRTMALDMVREGYVAVTVDNAAAGEMSDLECYGRGWDFDYDVVSRFLLEMGWSWLGYTSYLDQLVLDWMRTQTDIRPDRLVVSGFSLGTEPMMVLGVLNPDVHAFVYNDFLCQTQERALVMTRPNGEGRRPFPNSIRHLIPCYWEYFNFPDVAAALAPRPLLFTEGGLDRDFRLVQSAYGDAGSPENVEFHHYPKFADPASRNDVDSLAEGMDAKTYFESVNVDPPQHYFKHELVLPWLRRVLK